MLKKLGLSLVISTVLAPLSAFAGWPERPVQLIVPYAAGGGTDTAARMLAKKLSERIGQPVIVENKPGAATQIGTAYVARAKPDGYTLLMGTANLATNEALYEQLPYDVSRDLVPVAWATEVPVYLFVQSAGTIQDVPSLLQAAAKPDGVTYATAGQGSIPHLAAEMFARAAEIRLTHIPYKGSSEATTALAGGQVPLSFDNLAPVLGQVQAGKVKAVAVAASSRNPLLPAVPTLTELGYPVVASSWWGVMAPAGTNADVVQTLNRHIQGVLDDPDVRDYFARQGMTAKGGSPESFARHISEQTRQWRDVVKQAGIRIGE
jgi:tripartite-type tricarboxylate transporter receptor subunit TctC